MKACKIEGCDKPSRSLGMCNMHYGRLRRHGDPLYVNPQKTYGSPIDRFNTKIKPESNGCVTWLGSKNSDGYGYFFDGSKHVTAHRFIYFFHNPKANRSLHVMHSCDNPSCVNVLHLSAGTHKENMNDRDFKGRCPKGEKSGVAKLSSLDIQKIKKDTRPTRLIANDYGLNHSYISLIKRGKTWRHAQ